MFDDYQTLTTDVRLGWSLEEVSLPHLIQNGLNMCLSVRTGVCMVVCKCCRAELKAVWCYSLSSSHSVRLREGQNDVHFPSAYLCLLGLRVVRRYIV